MGAIWDNEDTRLVKITDISFPDGSYFIVNGEPIDQKTHYFLQLRCGSIPTELSGSQNFPAFDWMLEENHSWLEITPDTVSNYFSCELK